MALNFPLSPEDGDTYENYVYDATEGVWNANPQQLASRFITSATQPSTPSNGDGWLDTNTGKTYIYYNDGTSAQWIESGNPVIGFVDPYDQDSTSTGYFSLPKGTSAQRPVSPNNGDIRFNTELGEPEYYSESESSWFLFRQQARSGFPVEYLVLAGGGGGGAALSGDRYAGGGGAGGYRSSIAGESSGGGASSESALALSLGTYTVTVGAGGADSAKGSNSVFGTITSLGGGAGTDSSGASGGSGGGARPVSSGSTTPGGIGTENQGFDGGSGRLELSVQVGAGGGGGAGQVGQNGGSSADSTVNKGGIGGNGVASAVTGSSVTRAGGGGGASGAGYYAAGGTGGGGRGASGGDTSGSLAGTENTGGGGGGSGNLNPGKAGGSGIVIIKYPVDVTFTADPGLTHTTDFVTFAGGVFNVTQFTAGTGTVTFS